MKKKVVYISTFVFVVIVVVFSLWFLVYSNKFTRRKFGYPKAIKNRTKNYITVKYQGKEYILPPDPDGDLHIIDNTSTGDLLIVSIHTPLETIKFASQLQSPETHVTYDGIT